MNYQENFNKAILSLSPGPMRVKVLYDLLFASSSNKVPEKKIIKVNLESVTSRVGFSYSDDGWHPFVETLKEYQRDDKLLFEDSVLSKLYNQYKPGNLQEVLLDQIKGEIKPLSELPPINEALRNLWCLKKEDLTSLKILQKERAPDGWIFYGPHSKEYGEKEFLRLISIYESIKKKGYKLVMSQKDMINGYFLKKGEKKVFVLLQGNHRVSALKVLGYDYVDVVIRDNHPAVIEYEQLHLWALENGGVFPYNTVNELFETLFNEKGYIKAERYGLT